MALFPPHTNDFAISKSNQAPKRTEGAADALRALSSHHLLPKPEFSRKVIRDRGTLLRGKFTISEDDTIGPQERQKKMFSALQYPPRLSDLHGSIPPPGISGRSSNFRAQPEHQMRMGVPPNLDPATYAHDIMQPMKDSEWSYFTRTSEYRDNEDTSLKRKRVTDSVLANGNVEGLRAEIKRLRRDNEEKDARSQQLEQAVMALQQTRR